MKTLISISEKGLEIVKRDTSDKAENMKGENSRLYYTYC